MKYSQKEFNSAVSSYKKQLKNVKNKTFLILFDLSDKEAFYSLAPLSRAMHELKNDVSCIGISKKSEALEAVKDVWKVFDEAVEGVKNTKTAALLDFIKNK